jgi:hypothetical protein
MHSELDELLGGSAAADSFKSDVISFFQTGQAERVEIRGYSPRVKVARVLKHVLASHPELDIQSISIDGRSGCSDFIGSAQIATSSATHTYEFVWCCRWRAEQEGWTDYYGFPDQMRAAREYDWRCFQVWRATSES